MRISGLDAMLGDMDNYSAKRCTEQTKLQDENAQYAIVLDISSRYETADDKPNVSVAPSEENRGRRAERETGPRRSRRNGTSGSDAPRLEALQAEQKKLVAGHKEGCTGHEKVDGVLKRCGCFVEEEKKVNKRKAESMDSYAFVEAEKEDDDMGVQALDEEDDDMGVEALDEGHKGDEDWDMLGELYPKNTPAAHC